ncbi:MAG: sigma-54-dependent Fis family transcriptional regulator [Candidatus Omnitrophica bacterium]|nr:sigma-54-dependent Fis family transcriptional regulator [Candidatus Omnitrophota bacterium]
MKNIINILLVDDEAGFRETIAEHLTMRGYAVSSASCADDAIEAIKYKNFEVAIVDIMMPGMNGITLMKHLKSSQPVIEVIMLTGQGSIESAVDAIKKGAYNYLTKPVRFVELEAQIRKAYEKSALIRENILQGEELKRRRSVYNEPIAVSNKMKSVLELAEKVASSNSTVLLEGDTGTGKEVIANFIHRKSHRADKPFVVVNCGALPENILERELFGHSKGAFTGAVESKPGLIEVADEGTLLLDEIGEMSVIGQIALLRVLEAGLYRRLGETKEESVDVRVICATNVDLDIAVREKRFREDLYHRLNVIRVKIPPLRERREDIIPLAQCFLRVNASRGIPPKTLTEDAVNALTAYNWPGNVRELSNVIERVCIISRDEKIRSEQLSLLSPHTKSETDVMLSLEDAEKRHVLSVLDSVNGDKAKAASLLGITLRHLYRKLESYGRE